MLRLVLLVLGGALVLGIYLWERHKRVNTRIQAIRRTQQHGRVEPTLGNIDDGEAEGQETFPPDPAPREERHGGIAFGRKRVEREAEPIPDPQGPEQAELFGQDGAIDGDRHGQGERAAPTMILQVNVVAKDGAFEGSDILRAVEGAGMTVGNMRIFQRHEGENGSGPVLFSMASMVEPGVFPLDAMGEFSTPGLTLFAQLPAPRDGLALFSDMLSAAERLAAELGGELQDETHSRLTKQTVEHLRSQILEHRRRVQLAKSKKR